jgi:hypothetical protein
MRGKTMISQVEKMNAKTMFGKSIPDGSPVVRTAKKPM